MPTVLSSAFKDFKVRILKIINFDVAIVQYCFCLVIGRFFLSFDIRFYLSSLVSAFLDISFGHAAGAAGISWGFRAVNAHFSDIIELRESLCLI